MICVSSNVESIRLSAYHLVKAFMPDEEVRQEGTLAACASSVQGLNRKTNWQRLSGDGGVSKKVMPAPENAEFLRIEAEDGSCIVSLSGKRLDKDESDIMVYDMLRDYTGTELPWGVLTGVRPVKLASARIGHMSREEYAGFMSGSRRVSRDKALLSWDIAYREDELIRKALGGKVRDYDSYSLYIGIPVCPSICSYCSFSSGPLSRWRGRMDEYVESLCRELQEVSPQLAEKHLTSIYIGGGTPTVLTEAQQERLMQGIASAFPVSEAVEYTLEAGRPDTITEDKLQIALAHGVNRISINPQTMQQRTLDAIGRSHTVEEVVKSYVLARQMGFNNINMDLIAGLEGETEADMVDTLRRLKRLGPDSLTVHALAVKRAAKTDKITTAGDVVTGMIEEAATGAADMGMKPYYLYRQKSMAGNHENIGYAVPGKESIYNIMIMEEVQSIIACGAGSTTKVLLKEPVQNPDRADGVMTRLLRQDNVSRIDEYIRRLDEMIVAKAEVISQIGR